MDFTVGDIIRFSLRNNADKYFVVLGRLKHIVTGISLREVGFETSIMIPVEGERYAWPDRVEYLNTAKADNWYYMRSMTEKELATLREAVAQYLGIRTAEAEPEKMSVPIKEMQVLPQVIEPAVPDLSEELVRERTRADVYKELYMALLEKKLGAVS